MHTPLATEQFVRPGHFNRLKLMFTIQIGPERVQSAERQPVDGA